MQLTEKALTFLTLVAKLLHLRGAADASKPVPAKRGKSSEPLRYVVSTLFLREQQAYLCADPKGRERQVIVTGPIMPNGVRVPSRMEQVPLVSQSAHYVRMDDGALLNRVAALYDDHGHTLDLISHSHILYGAAATRPSLIDIENQERFAAIGWEAIGCIFSLDGYVRLFDPTRDFEVSIYGTDYELIEEGRRNKVIRLTGFEDIKRLRRQIQEAVA